MPRKVLILDTSILCCWLRVPGKDTAGSGQSQWDYDKVLALLNKERKQRSLFVLPIASLIETGNHIAQCKGDRHQLASALGQCLLDAANEASPWAAFTDQSALWETAQLQELAAAWPPLAASGLGIADATIKHVAEHYAEAGFRVEILTGDQGLKSYEPLHAPLAPRRRR